MNKYTIEGRLPDVIALISVLSAGESAFRSNSNLNDALRGDPISVTSKKWHDVAAAHPEFFRFNGNGEHVALLIRSYFTEDAQGHRKPLTVAETQKLIETAIALNDKEIQFKQRNSYWLTFIGSLLALAGVIFSAIYTNSATNDNTKKIDSVSNRLHKIEVKLDKVIH